MRCYHSWSMSLYDIDPGSDCPEIVRMIVEIPKGSANKYEYDGKLGVFRLDRAPYSAVHYPGDYGFIPGTLAEDRDPLDVLTLVDEPSYPGVLMLVRPVGVLIMVDQDEPDEKILAVPNHNPRFDQIHTIDQVFAQQSARNRALLHHLQGTRRQAHADEGVEGPARSARSHPPLARALPGSAPGDEDGVGGSRITKGGVANPGANPRRLAKTFGCVA